MLDIDLHVLNRIDLDSFIGTKIDYSYHNRAYVTYNFIYRTDLAILKQKPSATGFEITVGLIARG